MVRTTTALRPTVVLTGPRFHGLRWSLSYVLEVELMSKLISALVAGSLALATSYAVAMTAEQKDTQLSKMESVGNANAPARGEAIVKSGATAGQPMLVTGTT